MLVTRRVAPPLAAFVDYLWARERPALPHAREWGLPGTGADIIAPLGGADALRRFDGLDDAIGHRYAGGIVQGARERPFLRDTSRASTVVGVHLRPGGLAAFTAEPLDRLTDHVIGLADWWGRSFVAELRERLMQRRGGAAAQLALLETLLLRRLRPMRADPFAAWAIERLRCPRTSVGDVQRASGLSPGTFIRRFRAATGLAPKRYRELQRFNAAATRGHAHPDAAWAEIACDSGYADQAHLAREFRRFAGTTPGRYRRDATPYAMHLAAR